MEDRLFLYRYHHCMKICTLDMGEKSARKMWGKKVLWKMTSCMTSVELRQFRSKNETILY